MSQLPPQAHHSPEPEDAVELAKRLPDGLYVSTPDRPFDGISAANPKDLDRFQEFVETVWQSGRAEGEGVEGQSYLTARDIAKRYGLDYDALRKRLERYRRSHPNRHGWKPVEDRTQRGEKYLYLLSAIADIIRETPRA
jgi:hypothetical protein